jgi:hypothetical protein
MFEGMGTDPKYGDLNEKPRREQLDLAVNPVLRKSPVME